MKIDRSAKVSIIIIVKRASQKKGIEMSNQYVYCVICNKDGYLTYLKIFKNLEDAKKNFAALIGLKSATQARECTKRFWDTVAKFYDNKHNQIITPTENMLFYYQRTIHNFELNISVREYVLFDINDLKNSQDCYYFDECELIKEKIN